MTRVISSFRPIMSRPLSSELTRPLAVVSEIGFLQSTCDVLRRYLRLS